MCGKKPLKKKSDRNYIIFNFFWGENAKSDIRKPMKSQKKSWTRELCGIGVRHGIRTVDFVNCGG